MLTYNMCFSLEFLNCFGNFVLSFWCMAFLVEIAATLLNDLTICRCKHLPLVDMTQI